jgi:S-adenosylmethionine-diacylglycerol 3-amino-3-carboxypropyl transferase
MGHTAFAGISHWAHDSFFHALHRRHLVYNASWEDPRVDRKLLRLDPTSRVVVITGGGCNALDYLLDDAEEVHAVDVNPAQNALLQLKAALLERGEFDDLYQMFGVGAHPAPGRLLSSLGARLPELARRFWKEKESYFAHGGIRKSFYYRGTAGSAAWLFRESLLGTQKKIRCLVHALFEAKTLEEQERLFDGVEPLLWNRLTSWLVNQPVILAMMGVPRPQIRLIAAGHPAGITGYVRDRLRHVLTRITTRDNYFWRVYLHGSYTSFCRPSYLDPARFETLRSSIDRLRTHSETLSAFLRRRPGQYSHFVLLDHQDWLANHDAAALEEEWRLILANSRPGTRILLRSAGLDLDFLPDLARKALRFFPEQTKRLELLDRVGTYASTHLAEVL